MTLKIGKEPNIFVTIELIDIKNWERAEHFRYYINNVPCTYSITVSLDISDLLITIKERNIKLYPAIIYLLSVIVNKHKEFRTATNTNGDVGIFDIMHPLYTIFNKNNETFSGIWTKFNSEFTTFYNGYLEDVEQYSNTKNLMPKPNPPINIFNISSLPWVSFSSFNLNFPKGHAHLLPIFTVGKYFDNNNKILLPLSIQVHHAVCDGFHLSKFIHDLQNIVNEFHLKF